MLEMLASSKARIAVIRLFYLNPDRGYHLREVSRLLALNPNQAKRELDRLAGGGMLAMAKVGNASVYRLDKSFAFHKEMSAIVRKTMGAEEGLRKVLGPLEGIKAAFIFGSYAEGEITPKSDIDIMIIGTPDMARLNKAINSLEKKLKRPIQYVVYPQKEFKEKKSYGFVKNVMARKKTFILGDEHELG